MGEKRIGISKQTVNLPHLVVVGSSPTSPTNENIRRKNKMNKEVKEALELFGSIDLDSSIFRKKGNPLEAYDIIKQGYLELEEENKLLRRDIDILNTEDLRW